jgi:hypothetical protein
MSYVFFKINGKSIAQFFNATNRPTPRPDLRPGLTDAEILAIIEHADGSEMSDLEFARAVIAADRAKSTAN